MRHDLPSGAWIDLKDPASLKGKDQDRYERAVRLMLPRQPDGELDVARGVAEGIDGRQLKRDAVLHCFTTAWSFTGDDGQPLPVPAIDGQFLTGQDSIGDYPLDDAQAIGELVRPYLARLDRPDPKEVTTSASNGRSRATARSLKE